MKLINRKYINLVWEFAISGFKLREQGTILGLAWALLNPFLMLTILYALFSKRIGKGIEHYEIYLLIGILQWNFFNAGTSEGLKSIMGKRDILHNIYLPRTAIVISSVLTVFISFLFELIVLAGFLIFSGVGFSLAALFFPFVILIQLLLIIAISLVLACLNVYFRDMSHIWSVLLKIGFFLSPVFYPIPTFTSQAKMTVYLLNPMTQLIILGRDIILFKKVTSLINMSFLFIFILAMLAISCLIFKKLEDNIVERI